MISSNSPTHPDDVVLDFEEVDAVGVHRAVEAARVAQRSWWELGALGRVNALNRAAEAVAARADEITKLGIREVGKPRTEMEGETARGVAILRYYAQAVLDPDGTSLPSPAVGGLVIARRRPYGVVGIITPWNFPVAIPLWKAAPALAYGNTVVCKPAPAATAVALLVEEIIAPFLPANAFTVVTGDQVTGEALISEVDCVSFTGSRGVGSAVVRAATARGIPVQAEMGGQNPSIVLPDADVESAASVIAGAAMGFSGQKCTATSRVIVVGDPSRFTEALREAIASLPVGDPSLRETVIGPVVSEAAVSAVIDAVADAKGAGGRILYGGDRIDLAGYFVEPVLLDGVGPGARVAQEEIFGPFAVLLGARDDDEAVEMANGVRFGLVSAIFTNDLTRALDLTSRLETGLVRVNAPTSGVDFHAPFGGIKDSSYGSREQGKAAQEFYTWIQTLTVLAAS
ncbi:MAG: aldehyde dehydrogenase family protein [Acidimicrobiaceae bacterium]|nr:aldehyde dehydrogenase family protein [Acidimicrobiaceae bacterium]